MRFIKYIVRNALRNRVRTALTVLSLAVCLAMMSILYGYFKTMEAFMPTLARGNRLIVMNVQGIFNGLPFAYFDRIRAVRGVRAAIPFVWYLAAYKDERTAFDFDVIGTDAEAFFKVWDECSMTPDEFQAWLDDRQGCVIDRLTARRHGWKVGEHIPLKGESHPYDLDLRLRGIYDSPEWFQGMLFHREYLDNGLRQIEDSRAGSVTMYFVKAKSADVIPRICEEIDLKYGSSEHPTRSQSHQEFAQMFSKFFGNVNALVRNIGLAVAFALTLVAANAMAMSMRERTTEIAVLKAIGFPRGLVLAMILGEAVLTAVVGGLLGLAIGQGLWFLGHHVKPQFVPFSWMAGVVMVYGVIAAAAIGVASGIVPALRAAQCSVIDGLRKVG